MIYQVISAIMVFLVMPFLTGTAMYGFFSRKHSLTGNFLIGSMTSWAIIQLISVPLIILRIRFTLLVIVIFGIQSVSSLFGVYTVLKKHPNFFQFRFPKQYSEWISLVLMIAVFFAIAITILCLQSVNEDDSRFVVTATDMVYTDRMFLTNPSTGLEISEFLGDMHRDAVSPWAVYMAYTAKITKIPVAIVAHTIIPQVLILCLLCVYWQLGESFFHGNLFAVSSMVLIALVVNVYGVRDGWDAESHAMTRIWQGKAVEACIGIPALFLISSWIYKNEGDWSNYIFLYCISFAMCLMSGMGIILGGIFCGGAGIAYGILKKNLKVALKVWIGVLIPLVYYGISLLNY